MYSLAKFKDTIIEGDEREDESEEITT